MEFRLVIAVERSYWQKVSLYFEKLFTISVAALTNRTYCLTTGMDVKVMAIKEASVLLTSAVSATGSRFRDM